MKILVDTHCWLWMLAEPERLSRRARALVSSENQELYLSAASAWEISIKHALGRLTLPMPPEEYVPARMASTRMLPLAITHAHALRVSVLPPHHRDPFDRLLAAQSQIEGLTLLTADPQFKKYGIRTVPA